MILVKNESFYTTLDIILNIWDKHSWCTVFGFPSLCLKCQDEVDFHLLMTYLYYYWVDSHIWYRHCYAQRMNPNDCLVWQWKGNIFLLWQHFRKHESTIWCFNTKDLIKSVFFLRILNYHCHYSHSLLLKIMMNCFQSESSLSSKHY